MVIVTDNPIGVSKNSLEFSAKGGRNKNSKEYQEMLKLYNQSILAEVNCCHLFATLEINGLIRRSSFMIVFSFTNGFHLKNCQL
jgi:hypothetical protein